MGLEGITRFGIADYVIFAIFIIASLGIGVYYALSGGRQQTTKEYLTADKQLKIIPTALSLLVSFQSAIMILGYPAEMYMRGAQIYVGNIGLLIGTILTTRLWVPLFYKLQITSTFEYLHMRFDSVAVRKLGSVFGIVSTVTYMGTATFAPSTALEAVTGFPVWASILVTASVGTIYTSIGGMKAVIWTDVFQSVIMLGGILTIVVMGIIRIGSVSKVFEICQEHNRLNLFDFDLDPRKINTFWTVTLANTILWWKVYGTSQASVQRFCSLPTLKKANMAVLLAIPMQFTLVTLVCFTGLVVFAYYTHIGCDPLEQGYIRTANQILPYFVMDTFRSLPGFPGLFLATLFSGALSSISSGLNALSAITWEDFLKHRLRHLEESKKALCTKLLVLIYGVCSTGIACLAIFIKGPIIQASSTLGGAISGSSCAIFILAAFTVSSNWKGALAGPMVSFPIMLWVAIGAQTIKGHNQYLPPGPTDRCDISNGSSVYNSSVYKNVTS
ncbi:unnamed protein product [Owenia fusiformis]|nr:unnamed protein product [Owenia fusiformis]